MNAPARQVLCIDAGNTRIKWAVYNVITQTAHDAHHGVFDTPSLCFSLHAQQWFRDLFLQLKPLDLAAVLVSSVAGQPFVHMIEQQACAINLPVHLLKANGSRLLCTLYENPGQLGPDRWGACLAVASRTQSPLNIVVSVGTATTLDAVVSNTGSEQVQGPWVHLGGYICPGFQTMLDSLHQSTALLPPVELAQAHLHSWPKSTQAAISQGVLQMQVQWINAMFHRMENQFSDTPALWVCGGFAPMLSNTGLPVFTLLDDAVMQGLLVSYLEGERQ